jgi:hypothetical protein
MFASKLNPQIRRAQRRHEGKQRDQRSGETQQQRGPHEHVSHGGQAVRAVRPGGQHQSDENRADWHYNNEGRPAKQEQESPLEHGILTPAPKDG